MSFAGYGSLVVCRIVKVVLAFVFKNLFNRLEFLYRQVNFWNRSALFLRGGLLHYHLLKVAFLYTNSANDIVGT